MTKTNEKVIVKCYNTEKEFENFESAFKFYLECSMFSEGSEKERYMNILAQMYEDNNGTYFTDEEEY